MYDPKNHLTRYVLGYYGRFMTDEERLIYHYLSLKKAVDQNNYKVVSVKKRLGITQKVEEAIETILETKTKEQFYDEVTERLMIQHSSEIEVNRCPKCGKVARTNRAKQCIFCSHDWH